ncbi:MAG: hypothetical protein M1457_10735, partial [bacterium]|nr:hypothetical protein [bacterium]
MNHALHMTPARRRQGSVLILVIAILAVLALLTLALTYTTRAEMMASRNWSDNVQARMAALTGLPLLAAAPADPAGGAPKNFTAAAPVRLEPVAIQLQAGAVLQSASRTLRSVTVRPGPAGTAGAARATATAPKTTQVGANLAGGADAAQSAIAGAAMLRSDAGGDDPARALAEYTIEDEAAKYNINAIVPVSGRARRAHAETPDNVIPTPSQII